MVITAEEFCKTFEPNGRSWQENFHKTMIEFAKLYVADIDEKLAVIEDYAKGEAGVEITKLRKHISSNYVK